MYMYVPILACYDTFKTEYKQTVAWQKINNHSSQLPSDRHTFICLIIGNDILACKNNFPQDNIIYISVFVCTR